MSSTVILEKNLGTELTIRFDHGDATDVHNIQRARGLGFHLKTLYLFIKSDFKTVVFPQTIFAIAGALSAAGMTGQGPLTGAIVEDSVNKAWRPLPAGRLTPDEACSWLMMSIPIAVGSGLVLGAFKPSICLMTFIWMYNDLEGSSSDILLRNLLNAAGLMCFSWGALSVLAKDKLEWLLTASDGAISQQAYTWIAITGAVIMTTVHAQDMPDVEGDIARGRKTVPLIYGEWWARGSLAVMVMVMFWSVVCPGFWDNMPWWGWIAPVLIGAAISVLSLSRRGQATDEMAWRLWCLWASSIYLLPLFSRMTVQ